MKTNTDSLSQFFVDTLLLIHNNFFRQTSVPIPLNQFGVLCVLQSEQRASISDISQSLNISKQQMTTIIDKLVTAGLVERTPDKNDKRRSLISMTPAGQAILNKHHEHARGLFTRQLSNLTDAEQSELERAIKDYNHLIEKMFA